jgi:hypothetical protein
VGRRWTGTRRLGEELFIHTQPVPVAALRAWAGGEGFLAARSAHRARRPLAPDVDRLLDATGARGPRRARARRGLLARRLADEHVLTCWRLRPSPRDGFRAQLGRARITPRLLAFLAAYAAQYGLWVLSCG